MRTVITITKKDNEASSKLCNANSFYPSSILNSCPTAMAVMRLYKVQPDEVRVAYSYLWIGKHTFNIPPELTEKIKAFTNRRPRPLILGKFKLTPRPSSV